jgi:hypothetical protein
MPLVTCLFLLLKKFACSLFLYNWVITCINVFLSLSKFVHRFEWIRNLLFVRTEHHAFPCHPRPRPKGHCIQRRGYTTQMALIDHFCRVRQATSQITDKPAPLDILILYILCCRRSRS